MRGLDHVEPLPFEQAPQRPARPLVVLHHQDGARPRPAVAPASRAGARAARAARPVAAQDAQQPGAVDRLGQVLHGAQGEPQGLVVGDGEHHHRDVRQRGVGLEGRQHRPAVHPRHQHVQGDRVRARRAGQAQALLAPGGGEHPEALPGQGALQQVAHRRVVVDHQHRAGGARRARPLVPARRGRGGGRRGRRPRLGGDRRQADGEGGACAGLALHRHLAPQQAAEVAGQGQAQARAPEPARGRRLGLGERLEQAPQLLRASSRSRCPPPGTPASRPRPRRPPAGPRPARGRR